MSVPLRYNSPVTVDLPLTSLCRWEESLKIGDVKERRTRAAGPFLHWVRSPWTGRISAGDKGWTLIN